MKTWCAGSAPLCGQEVKAMMGYEDLVCGKCSSLGNRHHADDLRGPGGHKAGRGAFFGGLSRVSNRGPWRRRFGHREVGKN